MMLVHRQNKDVAWAIAIHSAPLGGAPTKTHHVVIGCRFRYGTSLRTESSSVLPIFPELEGQIWTQFPMVRDADRLYRLHQALARNHGSVSDKSLRFVEEHGGDAVAAHKRAALEVYEAWVRAGYAYLSPTGNVFLHTWKGAFLLMWGELPPFKQIRRWRRDRKARRLLAELEM